MFISDTAIKRPILTIDGQTKEYPRLAGLSSFGAGGANAHIMVQEYIPPSQTPASFPGTEERP